MKKIPVYKFYKHKYGDELLVDVISYEKMMPDIRRTLVFSETFYSITLVLEGSDVIAVNGKSRRLETMRQFYEAGVETTCFISPIFPGITDVEAIIRKAKDCCNLVWLENLNLRGDYKQRILAYIHEKYPQLDSLYSTIYQKGNESYWYDMEKDFTDYCTENGVNFVNAFYHSKLVASKKNKQQ